MDLFRPQPTENLLPRDGVVNYHGPVLSPGEAERYFNVLRWEVPWRSDEVVLFGKRHITARKVAWYGDGGLNYRYSGSTKTPLAWTGDLLALKALAEELSGAPCNSCLLNLYHSGAEGMGWHSDDESSLEREAPIVCLSLGAERNFRFRHRQLPLKAEISLEAGSLLVMRGETQRHWQHTIPKMARVPGPRISLTFRRIAGPQI
ncbi:MAG: alpha-ketoglutarate-dependent dioxygenase AlkB [Verrucomicrobiota bacterium]